jgi:hypothetical protein
MACIDATPPQTTFIMPAPTSQQRSAFRFDFCIKGADTSIPAHLRGLTYPAAAVGDGNCLYYAISSLLVGHPHLVWLLKFAAAIELLCNYEFYSPFVQLDYDPHKETADLASTLRRTLTPGAWASTAQVAALSTVLQREVDMWTANAPSFEYHRRYKPRNINSMPHLSVLYFTNLHFVPLIPEWDSLEAVVTLTLRPQLSNLYHLHYNRFLT